MSTVILLQYIMNKTIFGIILLGLSLVNAYRYKCASNCYADHHVYNISIQREHVNFNKRFIDNITVFLPICDFKNECIAFYKIFPKQLTQNKFVLEYSGMYA